MAEPNLPEPDIILSGARPVENRVPERVVESIAPIASDAAEGFLTGRLQQSLEEERMARATALNEFARGRLTNIRQVRSQLQETQREAEADELFTEEEQAAVSELQQKLRRLQLAGDQGKLSEANMESRTRQLVRQFSRRFPAFSTTFREQGQVFLSGTSGFEPETIAALSQLELEQKKAEQQELQMQRQLQAHGLPDTTRNRAIVNQRARLNAQRKAITDMAQVRGNATFQREGRAFLGNINAQIDQTLRRLSQGAATLTPEQERQINGELQQLENRFSAELDALLALIPNENQQQVLRNSFERHFRIAQEAVDNKNLKGFLDERLSIAQTETDLEIADEYPTVWKARQLMGENFDLPQFIQNTAEAGLRLDAIRKISPEKRTTFQRLALLAGEETEKIFNVFHEATGGDPGDNSGGPGNQPSPEEVQSAREIILKGLTTDFRDAGMSEQAANSLAEGLVNSDDPFTIKSFAANPKSVRNVVNKSDKRVMGQGLRTNGELAVSEARTTLRETLPELVGAGVEEIRLVRDPATGAVAVVDQENRLLGASTPNPYGRFESPFRGVRTEQFRDERGMAQLQISQDREPSKRSREVEFYSQFELPPTATPRQRVEFTADRAVQRPESILPLEDRVANLLRYTMDATDNYSDIMGRSIDDWTERFLEINQTLTSPEDTFTEGRENE